MNWGEYGIRNTFSMRVYLGVQLPKTQDSNFLGSRKSLLLILFVNPILALCFQGRRSQPRRWYSYERRWRPWWNGLWNSLLISYLLFLFWKIREPSSDHAHFDPAAHSTLRVLILVGALALHAVFEGLVFGVSQEPVSAMIGTHTQIQVSRDLS